MKGILAFWFGFCLCLVSTAVEEDEGVLVLTNSNFDDEINNNAHILVEFYAPWCGHCKALAPEYAKAAGKLAKMNSKIKLAKVDATQESELAEKFGVRGYPTMKFFKEGQPLEYSGGRQADDIVNWLVKKTGPSAKPLSSQDELKSFIADNDVSVVGFFKDTESDEAKTFSKVADVFDYHPFGLVSNAELLSENDVDGNKIVLYKKFDEGEAVYSGPDDPNELKKFIATESLPLVVEFNHETAQKIFGGEIKTHLLLFLSKNNGHFDKYLEPIKPAARSYRDKLLFVAINTDEPDHSRILEFFGLDESEVPSMRLIKMELESDMSKFKPENADLSPENVKNFVDSFLEGTLKEHLLTQKLPEDWDKHPVKVLVSSNFDEVAFDKTKDVLVEFYAPWCGHCKQLAPIYDKLGEAFDDKDKNVVIAKIDATANELEHTKVTSYPTIKLYKKETNEVVDFGGERTLEELTKFVESGGESGASAPFEDKDDEEEEADVQPKDEL